MDAEQKKVVAALKELKDSMRTLKDFKGQSINYGPFTKTHKEAGDLKCQSPSLTDTELKVLEDRLVSLTKDSKVLTSTQIAPLISEIQKNMGVGSSKFLAMGTNAVNAEAVFTKLLKEVRTNTPYMSLTQDLNMEAEHLLDAHGKFEQTMSSFEEGQGFGSTEYGYKYLWDEYEKSNARAVKLQKDLQRVNTGAMRTVTKEELLREQMLIVRVKKERQVFDSLRKQVSLQMDTTRRYKDFMDSHGETLSMKVLGFQSDFKQFGASLKAGDLGAALKGAKQMKAKYRNMKMTPKPMKGAGIALKGLSKIAGVVAVLQIVLTAVKTIFNVTSALADRAAGFNAELVKQTGALGAGITLDKSWSPAELSKQFKTFQDKIDTFGGKSGTFVDRAQILAITDVFAKEGIKADELLASQEHFEQAMQTTLFYANFTDLSIDDVSGMVADWHRNLGMSLESVNIAMSGFATSAQAQGLPIRTLYENFRGVNDRFELWTGSLMTVLKAQERAHVLDDLSHVEVQEGTKAVVSHVMSMSTQHLGRLLSLLPHGTLHAAIDADIAHLEEVSKVTKDASEKARMAYRIQQLKGVKEARGGETAQLHFYKDLASPTQLLKITQSGLEQYFGDDYRKKLEEGVLNHEFYEDIQGVLDFSGSSHKDRQTFLSGLLVLDKADFNSDKEHKNLMRYWSEMGSTAEKQAKANKAVASQTTSVSEQFTSVIKAVFQSMIGSLSSIVNMIRSVPMVKWAGGGNRGSPEQLSELSSEILALAVKYAATEDPGERSAIESQIKSLAESYAGMGGDPKSLMTHLEDAGLSDAVLEHVRSLKPRATDPNVRAMKVSQNAIDLIAKFEGFHVKPYSDRAAGGGRTPAIGYGFQTIYDEAQGKMRKVTMNDRMTKEEGNKQMLRHMATIEKQLNSLGVPFNQDQFDALASFLWNAGAYALTTKGYAKNIGDALKAGNYAKAMEALEDYTVPAKERRTKYGQQLHKGLQRRRRAEIAMFKRGGMTPLSASAPTAPAAPPKAAAPAPKAPASKPSDVSKDSPGVGNVANTTKNTTNVDVSGATITDTQGVIENAIGAPT